MKNIRFGRIIVNVLFYIFYVLIVSIIFSFVFPIVLKILGKEILNPNNPIFTQIQYIIIILTFILTFIFRKKFYLPIKIIEQQKQFEKVKSKIEKEKFNFSFENNLKSQDDSGLDIKVGREIK